MTRARGRLDGRMVFVVGARRSGTNWLQHLLTLHPRVAAVPSETYLFWDAIPALQARVQHGLYSSTKTGLTYMPRDEFLDGVRDFCDRLFGNLLEAVDPHASHLVERTPWHARRVDVIAGVYPDAAVLHIVRDPREVAASLVAQQWGPSSYAEAGQEWVDCVREARAAAHPRYREIRQEDLSADPVERMRELYAFVGLDADDDVLAAVRREAGVPVNVDRRNRAVSRDKWRATMDPDAVATVEAVCGELLEDLGYERSTTDTRERAAAPTTRGSVTAAVRTRVRGLAARRMASGGDTPAPMSPLWLERAQWTVDELMTAIACDDARAVEALLTDDAVVTLAGAESGGVAALFAAMPEHRRLKQRTAVVHGGYPTYTVVTEHEGDGVRHLEIFVVEPDGARVRSLSYYLRSSHTE